MRILTLVILMAINLGAAIMLMSRMKKFWWVEFLILMIAGLFILGGFFGMWVDAEWSYPMMTILFALSLANILWLYTHVSHVTVFGLALLANITGVVLSMTRVEKDPDIDDLIETYDLPDEPELDHSIVMQAAKRPKKKKAKKKTNKRR